MQYSKTGGENELGEANPSRIAFSAAVPTFLAVADKCLECGNIMDVPASLTILQIGGGLIPETTTGVSILLIGLFGAVTLLAMRLKSALALLAWSLTAVVFVLVILQVLPIEIYLMAIALASLAIGATAAYVATHA